MNDFQAVADRVEIGGLLGEFTDAVMMRDSTRLASLFTEDGVLRMPSVPAEFTGPAEIRDGARRLQEQWEFFVQNTHPGMVTIDGDTAVGRAYIQELARLRDGRQGLNHAIYHDRYRRTSQGWKFVEREFEVRYVDLSPLGGSAPGVGSAQIPAPAVPRQAAVDFTAAASPATLDRAAEALSAHGFTVEILDTAAAARERVKELIPGNASVFTAASETLRLCGIEADINAGGRYRAVKPQAFALNRETQADRIRTIVATPDVVVSSAVALTESGSLVLASATGSQLPANAGGAACAIWVIGAQKIVPDLPTALRRVEEHALPLEDARARAAYGQPSAVSQLLVLNAPPRLARGVVLLLREPIGF